MYCTKIRLTHLTTFNLNQLLNVDYLNPLSDDKILDWSKLKQIADGIFKCIENGK